VTGRWTTPVLPGWNRFRSQVSGLANRFDER
jgi:hypothetical protein